MTRIEMFLSCCYLARQEDTLPFAKLIDDCRLMSFDFRRKSSVPTLPVSGWLTPR
jgi:hypothetical protein